MDTDFLPKETYKAVLIEAEIFNHDLTLQFGLISYESPPKKSDLLKVLDKILYQYTERRQGPNEIAGSGIDISLVKRVLKMVNTNEYKRNQFCPIIRVSNKAFGIGRRMPIVAKYLG